jgi:hypothetical protein
MSKTIKQMPPVKGHRRPGKLVKKTTHHRERRAAGREIAGEIKEVL